jgi:hypothetical protein
MYLTVIGDEIDRNLSLLPQLLSNGWSAKGEAIDQGERERWLVTATRGVEAANGAGERLID